MLSLLAVYIYSLLVSTHIHYLEFFFKGDLSLLSHLFINLIIYLYPFELRYLFYTLSYSSIPHYLFCCLNCSSVSCWLLCPHLCPPFGGHFLTFWPCKMLQDQLTFSLIWCQNWSLCQGSLVPFIGEWYQKPSSRFVICSLLL